MVQTVITDALTPSALETNVNSECKKLNESGYEILNIFPITIGDSRYVSTMIVYETTPAKKEEYVTVTSLNDKLSAYATVTDMNQRALKTDIPKVPTSISSFANDSGFITTSALEGYAKKTDIPTIPKVPTKVSELDNDKGYITKSEADNSYQAKSLT